MIKKIILVSLLSVVSLFAGTINIAVAANVSYAIDSLKEEFKKSNPDTKIRVTLGSSGKLTAQINHGAPYDLFISANMRYPNTLYAKNMAITKPLIYARGSLALVSRKSFDFSNGMKILEDKKVKRIAIANPKTAPYGKAAIQAIKNAKLFDTLKRKFIYAESASQTLSYTMTATDIGFVAKSSLFSKQLSHLKKDKNWIDVNSSLYTPIEQGIVMLKHSKNSEEARNFYNFILSEDAKKIFKEYGYIVE
ncbi:MAG: molybdate ABC transporter substrate-binding protein [Campylobacterota bacterium]|nr:molybdate ABC transporter substrate-binding protein [Campylobacterota bacterium]